MRRSFLILAVLSTSGFSQSAQQQAQTPIVVQLRTPPGNPWMHAIDVAVPGFIGALSAWIAVWLTGRNNATTNAENHKHEMERWIRQQTLQAKKDFYFSLIRSAYDFRARLSMYGGTRLAAKDRTPTDQIRNDLNATRDAVEQFKLSLTSAISVGWIILSADSFSQIKKLDDCAMTLMTDIASMKEPLFPQSYDQFQTQLRIVVAIAKSDLEYT